MSWPEVVTAKNENRRELILTGKDVEGRIADKGFDLTIYDLTDLNYLNVHKVKLTSVPPGISRLANLTSLVLHDNALTEIGDEMCKLEKLKVLDLSRNSLKALPSVVGLPQLTTLNVSSNCLVELPDFARNTKLTMLDASNNKIEDFAGVCHEQLTNLSDVKLNKNAIKQIPGSVHFLSLLKTLDLSCNEIAAIPGELADCNKLKDLNLKDNQISDRRLKKLVDQCRAKQILDYVKQNCPRQSAQAASTKRAKNRELERKDSDGSEEAEETKHKLQVVNSSDALKIVVRDYVKDVRPHILACVVRGVEFADETFKKFIQLQTRLHDGICDKRKAATIATHDAKKLSVPTLVYTARPPAHLMIKPLNRTTVMSGAELFSKLQTEADILRKEKKRSVYSGIHKYLYLLEGKKMYPCLTLDDKDVISFPPITNSDVTKISIETTSILLEVTSSTSQDVCRNVLDTLLKEMVFLFGKDLEVVQVRNTDIDGNFKAVYPSKIDLQHLHVDIEVIRP